MDKEWCKRALHGLRRDALPRCIPQWTQPTLMEILRMLICDRDKEPFDRLYSASQAKTTAMQLADQTYILNRPVGSKGHPKSAGDDDPLDAFPCVVCGGLPKLQPSLVSSLLSFS